jgi:hypothetical protein
VRSPATSPQQTPFTCTVTQSWLQPLGDGGSAPGCRLAEAGGSTIGHGRNCSINRFPYSFAMLAPAGENERARPRAVEPQAARALHGRHRRGPP